MAAPTDGSLGRPVTAPTDGSLGRPVTAPTETGDADCHDQCAHWSRNDRNGGASEVGGGLGSGRPTVGCLRGGSCGVAGDGAQDVVGGRGCEGAL